MSRRAFNGRFELGPEHHGAHALCLLDRFFREPATQWLPLKIVGYRDSKWFARTVKILHIHNARCTASKSMTK
jgi:hypothetical protein